MTDKHSHPMHCEHFVDQLEYWLAEELDSKQQSLMQAHHDGCAECRLETRLAMNISAVASTLPEITRPLHDFARPASTKQTQSSEETMFSRLLAAWREPLVMVPAFVLLLTLGLVLTVYSPAENTTNPDLVVINGQEYTQEEIIQAAQDLEIALRYLDKYGSYPARVVTTELQQPYLPLPDGQGLRSVDDI